MKDIARKSLMAASLMAVALILPSCENDDFASGKKGKKLEGEVTICVNTKDGVTTRASSYEQYEAVELNSDGATFFMTGSRSVFNENILGESAKTRGEIVTTDNLSAKRPSFDANVLHGGVAYANINDGTDQKVVYTGGKWKFQEEVDWPDDGTALDFWAYSYAPGTFKRGADYKSFEYTGPVPGDSRNDATQMEDLILAHTGDVKPYTNDKNMTEGDVNIHFYHALAAVRFDVADQFNIDNGESNVEKIKYVSVLVTGVKKDGKGVYNGGMSYTWTPDTCAVSYEQVLFDDSKGESSLDDRTMFFVPQDLKDVRFTFRIVNYQKDADQKEVNKEFVLSTNVFGTNKWEAGYIYNYTIGKDVWGNVGIEVSEEFNAASGLKENVRVSNVKSSAAYIRATVVANWCTSGGNSKVYAPYTGEIEYNEEDWILYKGYYYSKRPVTGYSDSDVLIESFQCPSAAPASPYKLHLEMNIISQAVTYDQIGEQSYTLKWAWDIPDEVYEKMEKL